MVVIKKSPDPNQIRSGMPHIFVQDTNYQEVYLQ